MRRTLWLGFLVVSMVALTGGTAAGVDDKNKAKTKAKQKLAITSSAFADGETIPTEYTCVGAGQSPPLAWTGVPKKAKTLALVMDDPDAPSGTFTHWVVANFKPKPPSLAQGTEPANAFAGTNSVGRTGWIPPCPPPGPPHRYQFTLYALKKKVQLTAGSGADALRDAMKGKILAEAQLVGTFGR